MWVLRGLFLREFFLWKLFLRKPFLRKLCILFFLFRMFRLREAQSGKRERVIVMVVSEYLPSA